jgi:hypothetical protein
MKSEAITYRPEMGVIKTGAVSTRLGVDKMSENAVLDWVKNAKHGAKYDKAVIAIAVTAVKETKADGSPRFFSRVGTTEKTAFQAFRTDIVAFLDKLIRAEVGKPIDIAFPRRDKNDRCNPAYARLRTLRTLACDACCKEAGIKPKTGIVEVDEEASIPVPADADERKTAMQDEAVDIADTLRKTQYTRDEMIAILWAAIDALKVEGDE